MPISKLNAFAHKIADLPDVPQMTPAEFKAKFDEAPEELRQKVNSIVDVLLSVIDGDSGADNIGATAIPGLTGLTIQAMLEELKTQLNSTALGQVPDGSITPVKLSDDAKKASIITVEDSGSKFTGTNVETVLDELFTFASDGKTAVANAVTAKGVTASPSDTFPTLATKIGQIDTGVKLRSGSATSSANDATFASVDAGQYILKSLTVTELDFKPDYIYAFHNDGTLVHSTTYHEIAGDFYPKIMKTSQHNGNNNLSGQISLKGDVGPATVTNTGFTIAAQRGSASYKWIALKLV